ncbi:MAG: DUF4870 domain-containing protein [Bacteroidetes bacterium]|nr:DUF4870 domain-containing protein [Bacteroidota bacterium]MBS1648563.1 DUF4870 domain-containing protein [Bacteroidota bacterium]
MAEKSLLGSDETPVYPVTQDEKNLGLLAHIVTLISSFIAPLIIYILKKNESEFVAAHAKESLNFQITVVIVCVICFISIIGILFLWVVGFYSLILVIVATIRASEGKLYKYPFCIRLLK